MKRWLFLVSVMLLFSISDASAQILSVQVKKGFLKAAPSFLAKNIAVLAYGDRVTRLHQDGDWLKVTSSRAQGWMHTSALTDKKITLRSGSSRASTGVSSDEVMLAGKGFNAQVESEYRTKNPKLRFDLVDTMERYTVSPESERRFAEQGHLKL